MNFIQTIVLSDWFLLGVHLLIFGVVTRWALRGAQSTRGYALGWLVAIFIIVVYSSLTTQIAPTSDEWDGTLTLFQVILSTFGGLAVSVALFVTPLVFRRSRLEVTLRVGGVTMLAVLLVFFLLALNPEGRRMVGIFGLAFAIVTLLAQILTSTTQMTTGGFGVPPASSQADEDAPVLSDDGPFPEHENRLNEIRRRNESSFASRPNDDYPPRQ